MARVVIKSALSGESAPGTVKAVLAHYIEQYFTNDCTSLSQAVQNTERERERGCVTVTPSLARSREPGV